MVFRDVVVHFLLTFLYHNNAIYRQHGLNIQCDEHNDCKNQRIIAGIACNIDCSTTMSCKSSQLTFSNSCDYSNVNCSAHHSCYSAKISCQTNAGYGYCELTSGYKSMKRATINCPANSLCILHCTDIESCSQVDLHCELGSTCFVECLSTDSCSQLNIFGQNSTVLELICNNKSCNNINLYCPTSNATETKCSFEFHGNNGSDEKIMIFTKNGINDVEILTSNSIPTIQIFCGDEYESNCQLSPNTLQCTMRHDTCNGNNIPPTDTTTVAIYKQTVNNVFIQFYQMICQKTLLTLIAVIPLISCVCICCIGCCYANRNKYESIINNSTASNISFEGHYSIDSVIDAKIDEYDDTESISDL